MVLEHLLSVFHGLLELFVVIKILGKGSEFG